MPCRKFTSHYTGKATAAARAVLLIPICVCGIVVFKQQYGCQCLRFSYMHTDVGLCNDTQVLHKHLKGQHWKLTQTKIPCFLWNQTHVSTAHVLLLLFNTLPNELPRPGLYVLWKQCFQLRHVSLLFKHRCVTQTVVSCNWLFKHSSVTVI